MNARDRLVVAVMTLTLAGALSLGVNVLVRWARPAPRIETKPATWLGLRREHVITQCPEGYAKVCGDHCAKWCNRLRVLAFIGPVNPTACVLALTGASLELHGPGFFISDNARTVDRVCSDVWEWPRYEPDRFWFTMHSRPGPWEPAQ